MIGVSHNSKGTSERRHQVFRADGGYGYLRIDSDVSSIFIRTEIRAMFQ